MQNDSNEVNKYNFNDTLYGYLIRAAKIGKLTESEREKIFMGMRWALDEMTADDAREEYSKN